MKKEETNDIDEGYTTIRISDMDAVMQQGKDQILLTIEDLHALSEILLTHLKR